MDDKKQQTPDPKIKIEDLKQAEKPADEAAEDVTGGAGLQQTFNPKTIGPPVVGEIVGLVNK